MSWRTGLGVLVGMLLAASSEAQVVRHATSTDRLFYYTPAPTRTTGRVYYYVPSGLDLAKPSALLVFLHGGSVNTPDDAVEKHYLNAQGSLMPAFKGAPFIVVAPSALPSPEGSRWNVPGVSAYIDAVIADAMSRFKIDRDRIFLGGHSMGCYGAYHLGQIMADRFAGVWISSGGWWESEFRTLWGTPVFLVHGAKDCSPAPAYHPGLPHARKHHWCGVSFARAADELMTRYGVAHRYIEHAGGHSLPQDALRQFFAWAQDKRRAPYAQRCCLVTPCGSRHPSFEAVTRTRWLELVAADADRMSMDALALEGPDVAETEADVARQTYRLEKSVCPQGARIIAENLGGNRFRVTMENVESFRIYVAPEMGDLMKPFTVTFQDGREVTVSAKPITGDRDYTAVLSVKRN